MTSRANDLLRVAQWTTGNVAAEAVKALLARPDLVLVGAYAYSSDKVGVDVGKLCNLGRDVGICATDDVDALLALAPHCMIYTPLHFDVGEVERILRAGVNIVTSAEFMTGSNLSEAYRVAVETAAHDGDATIFGSGMNPGLCPDGGGDQQRDMHPGPQGVDDRIGGRVAVHR